MHYSWNNVKNTFREREREGGRAGFAPRHKSRKRNSSQVSFVGVFAGYSTCKYIICIQTDILYSMVLYIYICLETAWKCQKQGNNNNSNSNCSGILCARSATWEGSECVSRVTWYCYNKVYYSNNNNKWVYCNNNKRVCTTTTLEESATSTTTTTTVAVIVVIIKSSASAWGRGTSLTSSTRYCFSLCLCTMKVFVCYNNNNKNSNNEWLLQQLKQQ